jgi:GcrA cell cycle regulator
MLWDEDEIAILKREWSTTKTADEIARMLKGKNKNAVIGKAHRLGLPHKRTVSVRSGSDPITKPKKRTRTKLTPEDIASLEAAFAQGLETGHIVSMFEGKYPEGTVRARVTKLRAAKPTLSAAVPPPPAIAEDEDEEWPLAQVLQLKRLWAKGLSGDEIAKAIPGKTQSAIAGKARRLGLSARTPARTIDVNNIVPRTKSPVTKSNVIPLHRPAVGDDEAMIGTNEPVDGFCKWPFGDPGDPDFHYCGKKCDKERHSFCSEHGIHKKPAPNKEPQPFYFLPRRRR